jgi:site-specific recombinase
MTSPDDEQFKSYLKGFRPVPPEPLQTRRHSVRARRLFTLAAGATAGLAAIVVVLLLPSRTRERIVSTADVSSPNQETATRVARTLSSAKRSQMSTPALTKLALDDRETFNELMTEKLRTQFPSMNGEQSALRVLAKE